MNQSLIAMTNGKAAGQTPSSEEVEGKKKNASKKGTVVSQTVSKIELCLFYKDSRQINATEPFRWLFI